VRNKNLLRSDIERLRRAAALRERFFGPPVSLQDLLTAHIRVVSLMPVIAADLVTTLFLVYVVFRRPDGSFSPLVAYAGPAALAIAAAFARWFYYYIFSNVFLHRLSNDVLHWTTVLRKPEETAPEPFEDYWEEFPD
jgi:hypothetical protein